MSSPLRTIGSTAAKSKSIFLEAVLNTKIERQTVDLHKAVKLFPEAVLNMKIERKLVDLTRLFYHGWKDIFDGVDLGQNVRLKDRYQSENCIVNGTGRQLDDLDLVKLKDGYTFGCNFLRLHNSFTNIEVNYNVSIPPMFVLQEKAPGHRPEDIFSALDSDSKPYSMLLFVNTSVKP